MLRSMVPVLTLAVMVLTQAAHLRELDGVIIAQPVVDVTPTASPTQKIYENDQLAGCRHSTNWARVQQGDVEIVKRALSDGEPEYEDFESFLHIAYSGYAPTKGWKVDFSKGDTGFPQYYNRLSPTSAPTLSPTFSPSDAQVVIAEPIYAASIGAFSNDDGFSYTFPLYPANETSASGCFTDGVVGYFVNGVPLYSWFAESGNSYQVTSGSPPTRKLANAIPVGPVNHATRWHPVAGQFEAGDYDNCNGHKGSSSNYHHHIYNDCLDDQLGRNSDGHSRIFAFAKDGFPIHGPYQSRGVLASSCWRKRSYASTETGCPSTSRRSCVLVDPFDPSRGATNTANEGPSFSDTITTPTGHTFTASNGVFFEDYYFDSSCPAQGEAYLDKFNGHQHGDYPYHYHLTIDSSDNPTFPYAVGPKFAGCLSAISNTLCSTGVASNYGGTTTKTLSTCGLSKMTPSASCMDSVYTAHQTSSPTASPTSQVAPIVSFTTEMTLEDVSGNSLDEASRNAIINATATVMEVRDEDVSITSEHTHNNFLGGVQLMSGVSYTMDLTLEVTLNTVDYGNADPNTLLNQAKDNLKDATKSGALNTHITNAGTTFGSTLLTGVNVTKASVTTFSIAAAPSSSSDDGLSGGAIAGIVIAVLVCVALIITGIYYYYLWQHAFGEQVPQKVSTVDPSEAPVEATPTDGKEASAPVAQEVEAEQQVVEINNAQAV